MALRTRIRGKVGIVDLGGNLTISGEDLELREAFRQLMDQGLKRIVLNLEKLDHVDSSGLGEVVACKKHALERGGEVKLLKPTSRMKEALQQLQLTKVFEIFDEESKAVESF